MHAIGVGGGVERPSGLEWDGEGLISRAGLLPRQTHTVITHWTGDTAGRWSRSARLGSVLPRGLYMSNFYIFTEKIIKLTKRLQTLGRRIRGRPSCSKKARTSNFLPSWAGTSAPPLGGLLT
jgi:hypothetical protein